MNKLRVLVLDRQDARERAQEAEFGQSVHERQEALRHFYASYEDLVETLCDAAQYGPTQGLEARYLRSRLWMIENYGAIRKYLAAYINFDVQDVEAGQDAFESLFSSENLEAFLQSDDGNMISRITRTREALILYGDHLRQLAEAA